MKGINQLVQLSPHQRDIYFDQIRRPESPCYNVGGYLKLGSVDVARLAKAHSDLVMAHDAFGLRIVHVGDDVAQSVVHRRTTALQQVDLSSEANPAVAADAWIRQLFATPLEFENTEMFRAALMRLSESEYWYVGIAHHLAVDGWGFANWAQALARNYNGDAADQALSCVSVAAEQHAYLGTEKYRRDQAYWSQQCATLPERLLQPFYAGSDNDASMRSFRFTQQVSSDTFERVEKLASRLGVGAHAALLGALATCLGLTYRQQDVLISVAVHNRRGAAQKQIIGAFSSVSPLTLNRVTGSRFSDVVRQVASSQKAHFRHQRYPHGDLLRDLGRAGGHALLGDVGFSYVKADSVLQIEGRGLELTYVSHESERTPLMVTVWDVRANGGVAVHFDCNEAYFTRDEASLLAQRFARTLELAIGSPDDVLDPDDVLLDGERERILEHFNATAAHYPKDGLIHELFEQQAAAQPDAMAVICGESMLRYGELNARANQLAHELIARGVRPDDRVAICCERTLDLVVGLLGILKAGGAYVSLDPAYPAERLAFILQDSAPRLLLSTTGLDGHLPAGDVPVLWLDQAPITLAGHPVDNVDARRLGLDSRHLAYVIYTSGSTGTPKGVAIEHVNTLNLLAWAQASFTSAELSHTLFATSANFDLAVFELFVPLSCGTTVSLRPDVLAVTARDTMTLINTVPSGIDALLRSQSVPATVRTINLAGEALKPALVAQLFAGTLAEEVVNLYGPSETTTYSTWVRMGRGHAGRVLIGRPIANTQVYILDAHGKPVPLGVAGDLYIGGAGVARGYLNRPELTAERFVRDPFSADPQARMYKTGDLGRWLPDGNIEYLGRNDFQVKIRGFRIELGEIEARLEACAGVREAVVLAREDVPGDKRLVVYLTAEAGSELSLAELRTHLSAQLPDYMVPSAFVVLDAFPLTPNGKLDRKALPAPDDASLTRREYEAPQGEIEQALAEIWQSLLNVGQVGRHDHFFELGGNSLLVIAMTARLREGGLRGEVRDLFAMPVFSDYAATLRRSDVEEAEVVPPSLLTPDTTSISPELLPLVSLTQAEIDCVVATVPGGVANVQDIYPLLPSQQGILFHHMLDGEGDTYLLRALFAFDRREELDEFLRALDEVVARHDILRTAVVWEGLSTPVQVVHRQARVPVRELTLPDEGDALEELSALTDPRRMRLDLARAPLSAAYVAEDRAGGWMLSMLQHHLVCDHVTLALALAEIDAIRRGKGADLADEVPMRQLVAQALRVSAATHEAYFRRELGHIDEPTALFNVLNARQSGAHLSGATFKTIELPLTESLGRDIRAEARRRGVSPAVLFHVAWAQVLARCTGRNEVVFGTVLSGRTHAVNGADRALGMFINTLPIRLLVEGTAADAIDQARRRLAELLEHEHASLSLAQRCSSVPSSLPLFTALLNYRHSGDSYAMPEGMRMVASEETTNYPVSMSVDDFGASFTLTAQTVDGLDAARLAAYLAHAMESLTAELRCDGAHPLHALNVLPPSERECLLERFNATTVEYPRSSLIHELFEQRVAESPDAMAVVDEHRVLTYAQLNARANRIAHYLIAEGVRPDDRVALCCERSADLIAGLLGILKAGGAYVPLDAEYPPERLAFMLEDSAPKRLLLQSGLRERLPASAVPQLVLDDSEAELSAYPDHNPDARAHGASSRQLAYVIYTSGSTGTPKGVMVEHRQVLRLVMQDRYAPLVPEDGVALCANPAFDAATWEIWATLLHGARLIVITPACLLDVAALGETLQRHRATVLHLTAGLFHQYADALAPVFGRLRYLLFGGDRIDADVVRRVLAGARPAHLVHCYGPTETTTFASTHEIVALDAQARSVPIGRPIGNTRVYVLDTQGEPVPVGVTGEIHIGGDGVARGYLNREDLTQERFVRDPFSADPQARMYRTGDLGRWCEDGTLEFQGRNDFQVKIRGFRIEPGEIEAKLSACGGVREAVVLAREDVPGDKRLVAYWVAEAGAEVSAAELRLQLGTQLPEYMLPSAFVLLESFPLTPNGKLDRRALPAPDGASLSVREYEAPDGDVEEALAAIWRELLQVEQIGRHDHFFELGGHSLLVIAMTSRLRAQGLRGEVRDLFVAPVLRDYAVTLRRGDAEEADVVPPSLLTPDTTSISPELLPLVSLTQAEIDRVVATVPGGVSNVQDIYPLLPSQQGILFHHMLDGEGDTYLLRALFAFDRREELDEFLRALDEVVARHDILRTAVVWEGLSTPVQVVHRQARVPVRELTLPDESDAREALAAFTDPRSLRLDLTRAPLLAAFVAEDRAGGWMLSMLQHHLVCDHVTLALALVEIDAIRRGKGADLADEVPMRQLVAQALRMPAERHEAYFRRELAHIDEPTAPFGMLDVRQSGATYETVGLPLDASLERDIRAEARRRRVSPAVLFHVAWAQVLARCTGRSEVVFGTVLSGRMHGVADADRAWGMFINTLPIRMQVAGTAADAVEQTQRRLVELLEHEHAPLSLARRCSSVPSTQPLFTTLLNCRHDGDLSAIPGDVRLVASEEKTNYPISVDVDDFGDRLVLTVQVVDGLGAARLAACLAHAVAGLVAELRHDGTQPLHALEVLPPSERDRVLSDFNATTIEYPRDALIHQLFEQQAARSADAEAVVYEDQRLTYAELNARANQVAHYLRSQGVKPDDRVAICVTRSPEMVVGLLGILKAGAAYVPLDPEYPAERLAYMLEDSAPVALLTQSALAAQLPAGDIPTLRLDDGAGLALLAAQPAHDPDAHAHGLNARHLAYVIYTSGSTGTPKGVMVEHASAMSFIAGHVRLCALERSDRVLQFASFAFDSSIAEMMPALSVGATLVLRPAHLGPDQMSDFLETQRISVVDLPTAFWSAWARRLAETPAHSPGSALRLVIVSGESVELHHLQAWAANPHARRCRWLNNYGPTEATVNATALALDGSADIAGMAAVSIGRPVANAKVYLLDAHGEPVPVGATGELHIGGDGVARGYLNRPELTAERFVRDPFSADPQARMYRTGDLGRWLPDGTIAFLGRNDFQVKIRGYRIELGEIEARLSACANVREAAVLAREDIPGDKRLVAYVVPVSGAEPTAMQLREALQPQLPEYMVPSAFVLLDAFPLTPNGKLDRKALPAPDGAALVQRAYEAPLGEMEQTLARIWSGLLGVERVGRDDHFFELGGHSMLVMAMMEQLRTAGLRCEVRDIFAAPTLRECAAALRRGNAATRVPPNLLTPSTHTITPDLLPLVQLSQVEIDRIVASVPGGTANIQDIYPLLPMQEGMLFHHLLQEEGDLYLARVLMAFDDRAALDELLVGLQAMIDRHEVLRSGFYWEGLSQPVQVIRRRAELSVHECAAGPDDDAEALLRAQSDPGRIRLDLHRVPLMHVEFVHDRANGRWLAALLHHHINCDHLTMERVLGELEDWRNGRLAPGPAPLFRDVVAEACLTPQDVHATFFRENLAGLEAPSAPFGMLDVQLQAHDLRTASRALDSEVGDALRRAARQLHVPVSALFHAAFALVVARCSGRDDVVFGTVLSGRLQGADGRGEALGLQINTLPFRVRLDACDVRAFVHRCHQQLLGLLAHEQAPLALAQRISGLPASMPLMTSLLNYRHSRNEAETSLDWPGMRVLESSGDEANFPLTAKVDDFGTAFGLCIDCHRDLDPQRLLGYLETALATLCREAATACQARDLDVMPASERRMLLGEGQALPVYPARAATLHELFEMSAANRPEAVALVFEGEPLSYRALNEQANRLAHHLCGIGVGPEARVAICLERGFAQVIALLAVLKAGAAYVPLDPGHPDGRLRDTVADCEPAALVTSRALATRFDADAALPVLCVDDEVLHEALSRQSADAPVNRARAEDLAYIIYTSGSTGRPKGVMVEHRQVLRLFASCESLFDFGHRDVWTLFHSFAFDFSVWEIWGALLYGGRLVIVPQAVARSADVFGALLRREQVTVLNQTPSAFWALLAAQEGDAGWSQSLRWVVFGGEAFDPGRLRSWFDHPGGRAARLVNMYGITETTVHVTWQEIDASMLTQSLSPIGRPLPDLRVYLLDEARRPVPWGAIGEIHVAGAGLARGYWHREALTAERFIPDPFVAGDGRMYRSGDLARLLPDGGLDYLGRNDFQVKVRGYRIELGEIETALLDLPGVREAAVLARNEGAGDGLLVAYLTMAGDAAWTAETLREALAGRLPEHMLPGAFVPMEAFPLTVNGKLDRAALPPPGEGERARRAYEAPLDGLESTLAGIWQELLELPRIGRNDDFFELGGHSLLAVRLVTRIGAQFGCTVPIQALFSHRTLKAFAGCVQQQQTLDTWRQAMAAAPADEELLEQEWTEL